MKKISKFLDKIELYAAYVLFFVMLVICTLGVFYRFALNSSLAWSQELCRWCLMWTALLGASYCVRVDGHLYVDLLYTVVLKNHPFAIKICKTIVAVIWLVASVILAYYSFRVMAKTVEHSTVLMLSMKIPYASLVVGFAGMGLRVIQQTIKLWHTKANDADTGEPSDTNGQEGSL